MEERRDFEGGGYLYLYSCCWTVQHSTVTLVFGTIGRSFSSTQRASLRIGYAHVVLIHVIADEI